MAWEIHAPVYRPHGSQFVHGINGGCTLIALAGADVIAKGIKSWVGNPHAQSPDPASVANVQAVMWRIYVDALQRKNCAKNGAATQNQMLREASAISLPVRKILPFQNRVLSFNEWVPFLREQAHATPYPYPVLVQVAQGRYLHDNETGQDDEANLYDHAICIYGTQTDPKSPAAGGYIALDGDNPGANDHPQIYSLDTLNNAQPISMIAFNYVS
jgi:hypothetical protein